MEADWITKQDPYICCLQETHLRSKDTDRLKIKGCNKIFHEYGNKTKQKAGVVMLVPEVGLGDG